MFASGHLDAYRDACAGHTEGTTGSTVGDLPAKHIRDQAGGNSARFYTHAGSMKYRVIARMFPRRT